jgi:hypothetical protein
MTDGGTDGPLLFSSPDLVVRRGAACASPVCFVTFTPFSHERSLDRPGFGEAFLASRGIDAVHVISRTNAWFDHPQTSQALAAIAEAVAGYQRVVTYGSSMGGYAAIRFAESIGAAAAIAISPQYGLGVAAPFERRFRAERAPGSRPVLKPHHGSQTVEAYVLYDPFDLDQLHVDLMRARYPRLRAIPLPHAGHPAGAYLEETGLLTGAIIDIAHDRFDPALFAREARRRRRQSSQYFFTLARRLGPGHRAVKQSLARQAIATRDDVPYRLYLATLLEMDGDAEAAEVEIGAAQSLLPGHPVALQAYAAFLLRHGRLAEADELIARLMHAYPHDHRNRQMHAVVGALSGRPLTPLLSGQVPPQLASSGPRRLAWRAWFTLVALLTRVHQTPWAHRAPLPRWHERDFALGRQFQFIDEWNARRRWRGARQRPRA